MPKQRSVQLQLRHSAATAPPYGTAASTTLESVSAATQHAPASGRNSSRPWPHHQHPWHAAQNSHHSPLGGGAGKVQQPSASTPQPLAPLAIHCACIRRCQAIPELQPRAPSQRLSRAAEAALSQLRLAQPVNGTQTGSSSWQARPRAELPMASRLSQVCSTLKLPPLRAAKNP
jgi:hypothetical protein